MSDRVCDWVNVGVCEFSHQLNFFYYSFGRMCCGIACGVVIGGGGGDDDVSGSGSGSS